ncbi:NAD-dependent epimerase/dehydratase family protein [Kribbella sp. CA-293567]|uniref:NAD-dependent epimerase/dehydratase family protein n=1 Tax=Kribbella sp. CA-293567 TaxID=3002436 RepID=UPI0022DDA94F|nr:NAD-dependent epimerase/dehydratase family protein [Kribbella sp. CA-293567]WBQ03482.1 NAD-dependent epimerase/dehydratase family protein [Kribbella sp. CA-293567]
MRIVITGATGNVGTALIRRLGDEHSVVGVSRRRPSTGGAAWHTADLTRPDAVSVLREIFEGADAVVHAAWAFQPSHDLGYLERVGVDGTRHVIEAVTAAGVPHLVHLSSIGTYAKKTANAPVDESWPATGIPSSPYSQHKAAAERLLDELEERSGDSPIVTRMRPGIIGQRSAGSALLRYALPAIVPARALDLVMLVPLDHALAVPVVHADDVADAIARALERGAGGAYNLATPKPITADDIAAALRAHHVHVPAPVVRAAAAAAWHARLQPVDPGWLDLAYSVPLLDTTRAERELGWQPRHDGPEVLREIIDGLRTAASGRTPVLRPRTVARQLADLLRRGPVSRRRHT